MLPVGRSTPQENQQVSGLCTVLEPYRLITDVMADTPARVKGAVSAFTDIGADELILHPTVGDAEVITRLAEIALLPVG